MTRKSLLGESDDSDRWEIVEEDLRFLISQGLRDGDTLAARLGFTNVQAFERYCYRREIPLLHKKSPFLQEKKAVAKDIDAHLFDGAYKNPLEERQRAVRCVHRQLGKEHPSVPELIDMLGLASESQLVSS